MPNPVKLQMTITFTYEADLDETRKNNPDVDDSFQMAKFNQNIFSHLSLIGDRSHLFGLIDAEAKDFKVTVKPLQE